MNEQQEQEDYNRRREHVVTLLNSMAASKGIDVMPLSEVAPLSLKRKKED